MRCAGARAHHDAATPQPYAAMSRGYRGRAPRKNVIYGRTVYGGRRPGRPAPGRELEAATEQRGRRMRRECERDEWRTVGTKKSRGGESPTKFCAGPAQQRRRRDGERGAQLVVRSSFAESPRVSRGTVRETGRKKRAGPQGWKDSKNPWRGSGPKKRTRAGTRRSRPFAVAPPREPLPRVLAEQRKTEEENGPGARETPSRGRRREDASPSLVSRCAIASNCPRAGPEALPK